MQESHQMLSHSQAVQDVEGVRVMFSELKDEFKKISWTTKEELNVYHKDRRWCNFSLWNGNLFRRSSDSRGFRRF